MSKINIQPQAIQYGSVTDLLNGALSSLSGPVGFSMKQPRLLIRGISITNPSGSDQVIFALHKGASGASAAGTEVWISSCPERETMQMDAGIVLEAGDFLTGHCLSNGSPLTVGIDAEILF